MITLEQALEQIFKHLPQLEVNRPTTLLLIECEKVVRQNLSEAKIAAEKAKAEAPVPRKKPALVPDDKVIPSEEKPAAK